MKKLGLYVHIPFCERKCNYCDFYSLVKTDETENRYIDALLFEIKSYREKCKGYEVDSIFIGGGTPSYLKPENIKRIMQEINNNYSLTNDCEITMEANPNSIDKDKVLQYKSYGINRISLGIQSLDDGVLKAIGRLHNGDEALEAIRIIKSVGIDNINADVMFNIPGMLNIQGMPCIPGQTEQSIVNTLEKIINEKINHISFYSLKLEEGTPMFIMEEKGLINMLDDDVERDMYYSGRELMENEGYFQYEISNFCKSGFECKHNIKYWTGADYIGFGPFAHSCFENKRYNNISDINIYCDNSNNPERYRQLNEVLSKESKMFEYIMLGLRMNKGISIDDFNYKFEADFLDLYKGQVDKLLNYKLITIDKNIVKLSKKGMDLSNYVFEEFL